MRKPCEHCGEQFTGRSDKRFCCVKCKNEHNYSTRKETRSIVKEIDAYLHRNREILATLMPSGKKEMFEKLVLQRAGFRWDFFTGTYLNKEGKTYKYVYDYAWMDFTDQQVLVVKK